MSDNVSFLPTILLGLAGAFGVGLCAVQERRYRKAKRLLTVANSKEVMSVNTAIKSVKADKEKQSGYVIGKVQAMDQSKIVYRESRPRYLSLTRMGFVENVSQRTITASSFSLAEGKSSLVVLPYQKTLSFGIKGEEESCGAFEKALYLAFALVTSSFNIPLHFFDMNYLTYDGDTVTAFGTLVYNNKHGTVEMTKAKYLLKGSKSDLVKHLKADANTKWWGTRIPEVLTGTVLGFLAYSAYKLFSSWRRRPRAAAEPGMVVVDDLRCAVCHSDYRTVKYMKCGHLAACAKCDAEGNIKNCPICNAPIAGKSVIYLA